MEPERRIEKVLRAYAKKRRADAGAPPDMHPATRRLLQAEVARRRPKPDGEGFFFSLFASLGRKFAFAACVAALILISASLLLPALSTAKYRAQGTMAASNLKQIGTAIQAFASDNNRPPASLDEIKGRFISEKTLIDPQSGQQFVYVGAESLPVSDPKTMWAFSPVDNRGRLVLFADGHIDRMPAPQFAELSNRTVALIASSSSLNRRWSTGALASSAPASPPPASALDKEKTDGSKLVVSENGAARLEDRQRESVAVQKNQSSAAPAASSVSGAVAFTDSSVQASSRIISGSNSVSDLVAQNKVEAHETKKEAEVPAKVAKSENTTTFTVAANEPATSTVNGEELKAGAKLNLKQTDANSTDESYANSVSQQYAQTPAPGDSGLRDKKASSAVLVSFQVQQNEQNLRVIDHDGSVYTGYWQAGNAPDQNQKAAHGVAEIRPAASAGLPEADARADKDRLQAAQAAANYSFQVTGTNQSLKQNIVFTGNFMAITNGAPLVQQNGSFGGAGGNQKTVLNQSQSLQLLLSNGRITGTVDIGNTRQIQVNAVPTTGSP